MKLLVILSDRLSEIISKGELTDRYYNPGEIFPEVHILITNDDQVSIQDLQRSVGTAKLYLHNLPRPSFLSSFGWQFLLLKNWINQGIKLARSINPLLIRTHGNFENGYLAAEIKKTLGIPLVVSLHINPDFNMRGSWWPLTKNRFMYERQKLFEKETLVHADRVLPVYEPIREYAEQMGARRIQVCYNVLNERFLRKKTSYELHSPVKLISVGRQIRDKNPENVIKAAAQLRAHLTLVGNGPFNQHLKNLAAQQQSGMFEFISSLSNDELCQKLSEYDFFVTHSDYFEVSKAVLEAALTGLPIVLNKRRGTPVPEFNSHWIQLVENSVHGYFEALSALINNSELRSSLGQSAARHSHIHFSPMKTEQAYVDVYRSLLGRLGG